MCYGILMYTLCILFILHRTKASSRPLFQNKAMCISLDVMLPMAISRGLHAGSNLLGVLNEVLLKVAKGYDCDLLFYSPRNVEELNFWKQQAHAVEADCRREHLRST